MEQQINDEQDEQKINDDEPVKTEYTPDEVDKIIQDAYHNIKTFNDVSPKQVGNVLVNHIMISQSTISELLTRVDELSKEKNVKNTEKHTE